MEKPFDFLEVRIVRDLPALLALRGSWDELFDASLAAAAPMRFEWLLEWWRIYGPTYGADGGGLRVITVWSGGRLIGALPLYRRVEGNGLRHARLQFLSTGEAEFEETYPEYLDLLARPGDEQRVAAAIRDILSTEEIGQWDDLIAAEVSQSSALLPAWRNGWARGCTVSIEELGTCPIANLGGGFEAYLGRLSPNARQQARRMLRAADKAGASLTLMSTPDEIEACYDQLVHLHQSRWRPAGKAGCFGASRFVEFHRTLTQELVPKSAAVLAQLTVDGEAVAVIYGFVTGSKFDFYQSGMRLDANRPLASPGIVAHLLLMKRLADRGVTRYDFLRGSSVYKDRLSTESQRLVRVRVVRQTLRSAAWAATVFKERALRKSLRTLARYFPGKLGVLFPAVEHWATVGWVI